MQKACKNGHALEYHVDNENGNSCDVCGRRGIKAPENVWRCEKCDYDLCKKCFDEAAPLLPSAPPPSAPLEASVMAGYAQATAPPMPVPIAKAWTPMDPQELEKCSWLFAEALRIEDQAAEFDRAGKTTDAVFHHRRAALKLKEGLDVCPPQHPDKATLEAHLSSIQLRMVYLESLGTSPPSLALEDHIEAIKLTLDLSSAKPPQDQEVSALVAKAGISGSSAELTEEGYQLVVALKSNDEMKAFMNRILLGHGIARKVKAGAEANFEALVSEYSGEKSVQSYALLKSSLLNAPWIELVLDPQRDKLELAMELQNEAMRLEKENLPAQAAEMYKRSSVILAFVVKHDPRMQLEKVKTMVTARLEEVKAKQIDLEAQVAASLMGSLG
jgi:hypothetical protein